MKKRGVSFWFKRISLYIWLVCIIGLTVLIGLSTNWFTGTVEDTTFGKSELFLILLVSSICLGVLAFGILILTIIVGVIFKKKAVKFEKSFKGVIKSIFKILLILLIFPLFLLFSISGVKELFIKIKKNGFKFAYFKIKDWKLFIGKAIRFIVISIILLPIWIGGYFISGFLIKSTLGYNQDQITVTGTGSMYPTFPKGKGKTPKELSKEIVSSSGMFPYPNGLVIAKKRFFGHQIARGDIVVFINKKTKESTKKLYGVESGLVKRVVGLSGDTIELKDGIVYLNNKTLEEPYIAKARSTFGGLYLEECKKVKVPKNSLFVMGDNRKGSGDSREFGFININDVNHVLPLKSQKGKLDKFWRDTSKDFNESSKIKIDNRKYFKLLNKKREEENIKLLNYQIKLEDSASKRGEVILKYNDFSFEASRSGYTMSQAMADSNYSNIVYGESRIQGYYDADELIDMQFEFPETKKFLLNNDYEDVGIAEVEGIINGCPTQVLVQHFAGYVPPNYNQSLIDGWRNTLNNLNSIIPSWENALGYEKINQDELKHLLDLLNRERSIAGNILNKMESNQWLTNEEENSIDEFNRIAEESSALTDKLNKN